ncbi:NmrA family NAD(P)-binding protein [Amycolatopsis plumensis]|uniref:NmrA family NAD(P)-binding protein n=1 Tax=Amycolatopsis plumensis TaxID=236508 RepID=UPI0036151367
MERDLAGRADLGWSVLRPAHFMQNFTSGPLATQVQAGSLELPAGNGREAFVDTRDVAVVAARTAHDPERHRGCAYDLTGPEFLSYAEAMATFSATTGHTVVYRPVTADTFLSQLLKAGAPRPVAQMLTSLFETIAAGHGARPTDSVAAVTGVAPRSLREFARESGPAGAGSPVAVTHGNTL